VQQLGYEWRRSDPGPRLSAPRSEHVIGGKIQISSFVCFVWNAKLDVCYQVLSELVVCVKSAI
jgi:hypothetical protein